MTTELFLKFFSLLGIEIVLGIDNAIFLAILVNKIPQEHRQRVRVFGVGLAVALRMLMLWSVSWLLGMCQHYIRIFGYSVSYRNALLFFGGLFLVLKSVKELCELLLFKQESVSDRLKEKPYSFRNEYKLILQIIFIDLVLSFDSVIVAVSMAEAQLSLIVPAILLATATMLFSAKAIGNFMYRNQGIKALGVLFVLFVGAYLILESAGINISKSYLYYSVGFSLMVELINVRSRALQANK